MNPLKNLFKTPDKCHRPWTYWWWPGNSVTKKDLSEQMDVMIAHGIGGAVIVPIYAIDPIRPTLEAYTPAWNEIILSAMAEAKKRDFLIWLNIGGARLPGGPFVTEETACHRLAARAQRLRGPKRIDADIWLYAAKTHQSQLGKAVAPYVKLDSIHLLHRDERNRVRERIVIDNPPQRGVRWIWSLEKGIFDLIVCFRYPTGQRVEHPSPGWEGFVLDPYNADISREFIARTVEAFGDAGRAYAKSVFMGWYLEGFEAPGANFTPGLYEQFRQRRGYQLQRRLPDLWDNLDKDSEGVRQDMLRTLAELQEERFYTPLFEAIERQGLKFMLQPQGATANVMTLATRASHPMGETIGPRTYEKYIDARGRRFISSVAHHQGRHVIPGETYTRLHQSRYCVSMELMKASGDTVYLGGLNHIVNHGFTYSPSGLKERWIYCEPTPVDPSQTWWEHYPHLARYVARLSAVFQNSEPAADVLMYAPMSDSFARTLESIPLKRGLDNTWGQELTGEPGIDTGAAMGRHTLPCADPIDEAGYRFDYINGATLLKQAKCVNGNYVIGNHSYRIMVFHRVGYLPIEILRHLRTLIQEGCSLVAVGRTPMGLFGKAETEANQGEFNGIIDQLYPKGEEKNKLRKSGKGMVYEVETPVDLVKLLNVLITPDVVVQPFDPNFGFCHQVADGKHIYFMVNCSQKTRLLHLGLRLADAYVELWNPITGTAEEWPLTYYENGRLWVSLDFGSYDSFIVVADPARKPSFRVRAHDLDRLQVEDGRLIGWTSKSRNWIEFDGVARREVFVPDAPGHFRAPGPWKVTFPAPLNLAIEEIKLKCWTKSAKTRHFSGTARYQCSFECEGPLDDIRFGVDLGRVYEIAAVNINGKPVGVAWKPPHDLMVPDGVIKLGTNVLDIDVCNLGHNAHLLDEPGGGMVPRKSYGQTRAVRGVKKEEPLPSGLHGPVRIRGYKRVVIS
ncbi:MAG: glycosyl hydrolase [Candidatus Sumerlaeota bacterium]|nr:glycosyl hydrolase [Candidatus Sumerlaeota bacterium]